MVLPATGVDPRNYTVGQNGEWVTGKPSPSYTAPLTPTEQNAANTARNQALSGLDAGNGAQHVAARQAASGQTPTAGAPPYTPERASYAKTNAPLHPKTESNFIYGRDAFGLRRGAIVRIATDASNPKTKVAASQRYVFRFLFNPAEISFGNQSLAAIVPTTHKNPKDIGAPLFVGQESVSFSLLLDRTQEAYEQGISTRGTIDDVETLYRVCNGDIGSSAGFLSLSQVEIQWGPFTGTSRPLPPFPCYITSIDITHTQFTPRMVPIRTALVISAARLVGVGSGAAVGSVTSTTVGQIGGG